MINSEIRIHFLLWIYVSLYLSACVVCSAHRVVRPQPSADVHAVCVSPA